MVLPSICPSRGPLDSAAHFSRAAGKSLTFLTVPVLLKTEQCPLQGTRAAQVTATEANVPLCWNTLSIISSRFWPRSASLTPKAGNIPNQKAVLGRADFLVQM